jgi:hypothetical protein
LGGLHLVYEGAFEAFSHRYLEMWRWEDVCMIEKSRYQGRVCELDAGLIRVSESFDDTDWVAKDLRPGVQLKNTLQNPGIVTSEAEVEEEVRRKDRALREYYVDRNFMLAALE